MELVECLLDEVEYSDFFPIFVFYVLFMFDV